MIKKLLQDLPRRLMWMFAGYGITQLVGIPFVGRFLAGGLQMLSNGLQFASDGTEILSEYVRYNDKVEAQTVMALQIHQGAVADKVSTYDDGSYGVHWNVSGYTGDDISITVADDIAPETIAALQADWV